MSAAAAAAPEALGRFAGARARADGDMPRVRRRGHPEPHGRHDARGRRLRSRGGRPLSGRHGRGQADRGGGRRLLGRQTVSHADRRHPRHHAGRARDPDAAASPRSRWATNCSAACWTARAGRSTASASCAAPTAISLTGEPLNPLMRRAIRDPLDVGVRSINSLLAVGGGQRIGLFAGSGVGKSVLLGMMTRYTKADVTVVGLIGERGREVQDFVSNTLGSRRHAPRRGGRHALPTIRRSCACTARGSRPPSPSISATAA